MASYSTLRKALLASGLRDAGFTAGSEYLVRDMGECVGGIEFQKSKYDSAEFYIEAGVLSKRLDRFELRFTSESRSRPYGWERAQIRMRLDSGPSDDGYGKWILRSTQPITKLADRMASLLLNDGVHLFNTFGTDEKMRDGLLARKKPHGYSLSRGVEWPARHAALVYAAILIDDIGPRESLGKTIAMARSAAKTPMERDWVNRYVKEMRKPPLNPEDMSQQEAFERLRELTGQDFGNDYEDWNSWLKSNPQSGTHATKCR